MQLVETNTQWKDFIMRGSVQSVKQLRTVKNKQFLNAFRVGKLHSIIKLKTRSYLLLYVKFPFNCSSFLMFIQKCKTSAGFINKRPDPGVSYSDVNSLYFIFIQQFFRSESHKECFWWSTWWQIRRLFNFRSIASGIKSGL